MHFSHREENEECGVGEVVIVVGSLLWHIVGTSLAGPYSVDYVSTTFQHFLPGLVCCSSVLSSARLIPFQGRSLLTHFF